MKVCFKCKKRKLLSEFYKHPQMADGHLGKCKDCTKADVRKNRKRNIDYYRAYDVERGSRQTEKYRKRYAKKNPIAVGARNMVNNAVRDGRLEKPRMCEACDKKGRLHGHHDDYARPLEVRWLCAPCHKAWHAKHGMGLNAR